MTTYQYAFIGAGNMAKGIIGGMIHAGTQAKTIIASTQTAQSGQQLTEQLGVINTQNNNDCLSADVIVLAVKPQILPAVLTQLDKPKMVGKLIITVIAGIPCRAYQKHLGQSIRLVRTMPNMPAKIGLGMTGLYAINCSETDRHSADSIMRCVGKTLWLEDESHIDYVNAISGSGPAYFYRFIHHLAEAGEKLGLSYQEALTLAIQTAIGSAKFAEQQNDGTPDSMKNLIKQITSKGGTTFAAMQSFDKSDFATIIDQAVEDCYQRAVELGQ
ncbi:MAG: pyrroline-5-carboxylate reductase [Gammaproteobacteria bacterium]|nr:MAG: pyrroline-5-carboxylate reductase [Gammaproteobacteria bacterium]